MRTIYLVRHGLSEANNRNSPAFGASDAELMQAGVEHAQAAGRLLIGRYALLQVGQVAASTMRRAQQTAQEAGFGDFTAYSCLDEIAIEGTVAEQREGWYKGKFDGYVTEHALTTLARAPHEQIWFTHGLRIGVIWKGLGHHQEMRPIPRFGEVREITIDT